MSEEPRISGRNTWQKSDFFALLERTTKEAHVVAHGIRAQTEQKLLGFICSHFVHDYGEILLLHIAESHRNQGFGEELLREHRTDLVKRGLQQLTLEVADNNFAALRLYEKCHFLKVGKRTGYYSFDSLKGNDLSSAPSAPRDAYILAWKSSV